MSQILRYAAPRKRSHLDISAACSCLLGTTILPATMKWPSLSFWLSATVAVAQAASNNGELYVFEKDASTPSRQHHTISHDAARLILASRLGVDRYHDAGVVEDETLFAINDLGGSKKLFEDGQSTSRVAVLLSTSDREHFSMASATR